MTGAVVVVVVDEPEVEPEDESEDEPDESEDETEDEPEVEGVDEPEPEDVAPEVVDVDVRLDTEDEWATVSVATSAPRPTAADVAAIPMTAVTRRTRTMALSLACSAGRWAGRG